MSTYPSSPASSAFLLDARSLEAQLEDIKRYCQTLSFDAQHRWDAVMFAQDKTPAQLARDWAALQGELAPHQALLLAFLQMLERPRALLNDMPARHRDYYYRDYLGLRERPAQADRADVSFTLQPSLKSLELPAGVLLDAGPDDQGRPRHYQLEQSILVNSGKLSDVRWVRAADAKRQIAYDSGANAAWPENGLELFVGDKRADLPIENARLIVDERLRLRSGRRVIHLTFDSPVPRHGWRAQISVAGEWQSLMVSDLAQCSPTRLILSAAEEVPAFTGALGLDGMASVAPVLKLSRDDGRTVPEIKTLHIQVERSLNAELDTVNGRFSNNEVCYPFGVQPKNQESEFTLVMDEWRGHSKVTASLMPLWPSVWSAQKPGQVCMFWESAGSPFSEHSVVDLFPGEGQGISFIIPFLPQRNSLQESRYVKFRIAFRVSVSELRWERLRIDWFSEGFKPDAQYQQHPFGYGLPPWSQEGVVDLLTSSQSQERKIKHMILSAMGLPLGLTLQDLIALGYDPRHLLSMDVPLYEWVQDKELNSDALLALSFNDLYLRLNLQVSLEALLPYFTLQDLRHLPYSYERISAYLQLIDAALKLGSVASTLQAIQPHWVEMAGLRVEHQPSQSDVLEILTFVKKFLEFLGAPAISGDVLYLGFSDMTAGQALMLSWRLSGPAPQSVCWSYLGDEDWHPLPLDEDQTGGLSRSGLWRATLPGNASRDTTLMPAGRHWIRATLTLPEAASGSPAWYLHGLRTNSGTALLQEVDQVSAAHFQQPLPAGSITHLVDRLPGVARVEQPWPSRGGRPRESSAAFAQRAASLLGHRGRVITAADLQAILLEQHPEVSAAQMLAAAYDATADRPRQMVVAPALGQEDNGDILRPTFSLQRLQDLSGDVLKRASPWLKLQLLNPRYQDVFIRFDVDYRPGVSVAYGASLLWQALQQRYLPWVSGEGAVRLGQPLDYTDMLDFIQQQDFVLAINTLLLDNAQVSVPCPSDTVLVLCQPHLA